MSKMEDGKTEEAKACDPAGAETCMEACGMKLSKLTRRNSIPALCVGHFLAVATALIFQQGALPGFTRWDASPRFSTWSLISGALGSFMVLLGWPCWKREESSTLTDPETGSNTSSVEWFWGPCSVATFFAVTMGMLPITLAPYKGEFLPLVLYLLLVGSASSFISCIIFRRAFQHDVSPNSFTHRWKVAVTSPIGWAFLDIAVSLSQWREAALEYAAYGAVIWLLVAPLIMDHFIWLAQRFHAPQGTIFRDLLKSLLVNLAALPAVMIVCGAFLGVQQSGLKHLSRAGCFTGFMVLSFLLVKIFARVMTKCSKLGGA